MRHAPQISGQVDIQFHAYRFVRQSGQDAGNSIRVIYVYILETLASFFDNLMSNLLYSLWNVQY